MPIEMRDVQPYFDAISLRLGDIEAQLVLVSEKVGLTFVPRSAAIPTDVVDLVRAGDKLGAMRRYRELTGASGEEARDAIAGV